MKGHTRKIRHDYMNNDFADATIFTNGGAFFSVHFMKINEDGSVAREHWRSFRGWNAKLRAYRHADIQLRIAAHEEA